MKVCDVRCRYFAVQFFRLPAIFPCSAPQLQTIIKGCMSNSEPVAPGKKYLQNATLSFLPEASWAVPRPLLQRRDAAAAEPSSQMSVLVSPSSMMSPISTPLSSLAPPVGFLTPRQSPRFPLNLYVEISPKRSLQNELQLNVTPKNMQSLKILEPRSVISPSISSSISPSPLPSPYSQPCQDARGEYADFFKRLALKVGGSDAAEACVSPLVPRSIS